AGGGPSAAGLPPVAAGTLSGPEALLALVGLLVIAALLAGGRPAALLTGMAVVTALALLTGHAHLPEGAWWSVPRLDTFGQADLGWSLRWAAVPLLLSLMMVDFFDTLGTATAIADEAGLHDERGRIPGLRRLLAVDAVSA